MFFQKKFFKKGFFRKFFVGFVLIFGLFAGATGVYAEVFAYPDGEDIDGTTPAADPSADDEFLNPQGTTILPNPWADYKTCEDYFKANAENFKDTLNGELRDFILGCAIKTGRVHMYMIPYFIVYLIDVLVKLAATLCVLFIVIGGFQYAIGGISDEKEKAKKTILNAIYGLIVTSMAWIVINVIQVAITSGGA